MRFSSTFPQIVENLKQEDPNKMNFEDYFNPDTPHVELLRQVRQTVRSVSPQAVEKISYQMPAWFAAKANGGQVLHYVGTQAKHLGFYPRPAFISAFTELLKPYKTSKGAIQLPYGIDREALMNLTVQIIHFNLEVSRHGK